MKGRIVEMNGKDASRGYGWLSPGTLRYGVPLVIAVGMTMIVLSGRSQTSSQPDHPHSIILPEANRPPDANDQIRLHEKSAKKLNFDAANAERKRQMDDEATKLLILAKDLKSQTDNLDTSPLTHKALKEAEVIELLARDVKEKMKLTVGGS